MMKLKSCEKKEIDNRIIIGQIFGNLTVLEYPVFEPYKYKNGYRKMAVVLCKCGVIKNMLAYNLLSGRNKNCGCMRKKPYAKTHGLTNTKEYKTWARIKTRCFNVNDKSYDRYGGVGITMHHSWVNSFETFFKDVGPAPKGDSISIDRYPDKNGNYEPGNVRWADIFQQANNKNNNVFLTIDGVQKSLKQWCIYYGVGYKAAWARVNSGWDLEKAVKTPIREHK